MFSFSKMKRLSWKTWVRRKKCLFDDIDFPSDLVNSKGDFVHWFYQLDVSDFQYPLVTYVTYRDSIKLFEHLIRLMRGGKIYGNIWKTYFLKITSISYYFPYK